MARDRMEIKKRNLLQFVLLLLVVLLLVVYGRVVWIKLIHGEEYSAAVENQQMSRTDSVLPAIRGTIYDAKGQVLAKSERVYNIVLDCKIICDVRDSETPSVRMQYESTVNKVSEVLGLDISVLESYFTEETRNDRYELMDEGRGISASQKQILENAKDDGDVVGIWFEEAEERRYINGSLMAHVLGFKGSYGVEQVYNEYLSGVNGRQMIAANANGSYVEEYTPSQNGDNLTLTLDATIQYYMEKALADGCEEYEALQGSAIAMNPNTGEILGMCNVPTFDCNDAESIFGVSEKFEEKYGTPETNVEFNQHVWKNHAVNDTYEAGSTFKPIFASAAMEEAVVNGGTSFYCEGTIEYYDADIQCAYGEAHHDEKLEDVIVNSCNIGMLNISSMLGAEKWYDYQNAFGIGEKTNIDLVGEVSASTLVYGKNMNPIELATTSFGQGFNVTPIQLITAFSSVINGGELLEPYVVSKITDVNGNVVLQNSKEVVRYPISESVSTAMRGYLKSVVEEGTGSLAQVEGYNIGGKTGTAQKVEGGKYIEDAYVCSFIGFAPVEDPQIVLLVILDEPSDGTSNSPSTVAAEMLKNILPYMNIYPDKE